MSRATLARRTALAPSTITAVVKELTREGVVVETPATELREAVRSGPRSRGIALNPSLGYVVGIDFGFRTVRLLLSDVSAREIASVEGRLPDRAGADEGLKLAADLLGQVLGPAGLRRSDVAFVGIALPGPVDPTAQEVVGSAILPGWAGESARSIGERLDLPVALDNDTNLAALGEHVFGAGRGSRSSLTVKFHSGIGAGVIVGNVSVSGHRGGAGEIGHFLVDPRGPLCRCGKRGCLDTYAAVPAILSAMRSLHPQIDFPGFIRLLADRDPGAERVAQDAAALVGHAVATANLLLAPEVVIVVGAMSRAGDVVLEPIRAALVRESIPESHEVPRVILGSLGDRHTATGAVALALQSLGWLATVQH